MAQRVELEVTNTGGRPIYYLEIVMDTELTVAKAAETK